jgi:deazaflavin-dependent oxidoreductase (nitroreductase family)
VPLQTTLEVPGRRTGKLTATAVVPVTLDGERYLVSMLGDRSEWVRNVRAAGGAAVLHHGARVRVRLELLPVDERAPVIKRFVRRAIGGRPHIPVRPDAPVDEFAMVAARYPVFRIVPA